MIKNLIAVFILCLILGSVAIAYKTPFSYCDTPLTYKIGSIDTRFKLDQAEALGDIEKAANILDSNYNKKLFEYDSDTGEITINFVYDQRSALVSDIGNQKSEISKTDSKLKEKIDAYEADIKLFLEKVESLNSTIQKYNNEGGAPPDVYERLISEQNQLKIEGEALNVRARELNLETNNYNSSIKDLNANVSEFNKALAQKPEEGLYDGAKKTITIYFMNSKDEMIHTLAHEFGHAIGMDHVENSKALMYPQTSEYLKLTDEDMAELSRVCKEFPLLNYWIYEFRLKMHDFVSEIERISL